MTADNAAAPSASGAVCPSCNRYIGPAQRCSYCHADATKPPMLRWLRVGSVVLAVAGLLLLYLAVTHRELPVQKIGAITPLMNYAYVRVVGTVPRNGYVGNSAGTVDYVSFVVEDDTGSIRVKAQGDVALTLAETDRVPQRGMEVDVTGGLYVVPGRKPDMRLRSPRQLHTGKAQ